MEAGKVSSRIRIGIIGGFAALGAACVLVMLAAHWSARAEQWVEQSLDLERNTWELFSLVQDAETGQRGFLLTGDPSYLTPYLRAKAELPQREQQLRYMMEQNPAKLDHVFGLVASKMDELSRTVELRSSGNTQAAMAIVRNDSGRQLMRQLRQVIQDMDRSQNDLLRQRVAAAERQRWMLSMIIMLTIVVAAGLAYAVLREGRRHGGELRRSLAALEQETQHREETEAELRQAQKMEAIGQLTRGLAHDFNNMLTVVVGNIELLLRRLSPEDEKVRGPAVNALDGASQAVELARRLLAFSHPQAPEPRSTDIAQCIRDVSALLRRSLGENITIETSGEQALWLAFVDRSQLESALVNLALNSRDAMEGQGRLAIRAANVVLTPDYALENPGALAGEYVVVAMTDTGGGMTPEVMQKAFDPFFTTKLLGKGKGLGLSQVHSFVSQSRGYVKIHSDVGIGTTVQLYLPRDYADMDSTREEGIVSLPDLKVLVIDDDQQVRTFVVHALRELGYMPIESDGIQSAAAALGEHPDIAIVLSDVVMPDSSGRKPADLAKAWRPDLIVIYMTGYARTAGIQSGMLGPGARLISKPFTMAELGRELQAALREYAREKSGA